MARRWSWSVAAGLAMLAGASAYVPAAPVAAAAQRTLPAFESDAQLAAFIRRHAPPPPAAAPPAMVAYDVESAGDVVVTGALASAPPAEMPSITNNQEKGVDEGGIVKLAGETLVVLRRGRLFTVSLAGGGLRVIDRIDAFPPGTDGDGWYDEMLVSGNRVVVIGYSYARGGTEINRFRLAADGRLAFEDAYQLRSNDYYSSRNYAARLIGTTLVTYAPLDLGYGRDLARTMPGLRKWRGGEDAAYRRIARARDVYVPTLLADGTGGTIDTLHTVTRCDLTAPVLDCRATGVLGAASRTFYVSQRAVYLWISDAWDRNRRRRGAQGFVYRLPLDGSAPQAVAVRGGPIDQFSFREDAAAGRLDVLVQSGGGDDRMWRPEVAEGDLALLQLPLAAFGDGGAEAPLARYRPLPRLAERWGVHDRFVGRHLLYGAGGAPETREARTLHVVPVDGGAVASLDLPHGVDRIEALGSDAVAIGPDAAEALRFTPVALDGTVRLGEPFRLPGAQEGETRSHGFFFRPDAATPDGASGLLGLPVAREAAAPVPGLGQRSAAMLFLARRDRHFVPAGELAARPAPADEDAADDCKASCVDWYGNARPIFLGDRLLALMGYEIVEGRLDRGRVAEVRRVDFAPRAQKR